MSSPSTSPAVESYFQYFTEIEECFRRCRGTPVLLSTLDWALIESWKEAGIPLAAVLLGVERAFEKYARRPARFSKVNSLAYCAHSVLEAADSIAAGQADAARRPSPRAPVAPFTLDQIKAYLDRNARALRAAAQKRQAPNEQVLAQDFEEAAAALDRLAEETHEAPQNIQPLENQVSALEEKLTASVVRACPAETLVELRRQVERGVAPYRSRMNAAQLDALDRQFLKRTLYEHYNLPRLSFFYCSP